MTSGHDVSEYLHTLGLVRFSIFLRKNKKIKKMSWCSGAPTPQRMRRFVCLQDCLLTNPDMSLSPTGLCLPVLYFLFYSPKLETTR